MEPFILFLLVPSMLLLFASFVVVQLGTIAVVTIVGKYRPTITHGLNLRIPFNEQGIKRLSSQKR